MYDLLDELSELVYVSDPDNYDLLFMNKAGCALFGVEDAAGRKCYEVMHGLDQPCPYCCVPSLQKNAFITWECPEPVKGRHYIIKEKLIEWQKRRAHIGLAFDITDTVRRRTALKNALDAQYVIMDCVKLLHTAQSPGYAMDRILEKIGVFLEAERAYVFEIRSGVMNNTHEWCAAGIEPQIDSLQNLPVDLNDQGKASLLTSQCLLIDDLEKVREVHPQEYEALCEQGIGRLVAVPLELDGTLFGYIGVDNPPSEKIENISPLLETLSYFLSSSLRRQSDRLLLETLNYFDPLTGALNRSAFLRDVEAFMSLPETVGVVCIDINGMKELNDMHGHPYGDRILVQMAETIIALFGPGSLYRTGGDEFVIICRSIGEADLENRVRELRGEIDGNMPCRASIGSRWAEECSGLQRILFEADETMYADKKDYYHGRSGSRYRHNNDDILGLTKPGTLQHMLDEGRFLVYYQPKVSVATGLLIGAEALIRLHIPPSAIIAPDQFIPLLEQARLISLIDFYVFEQVCADIAGWLRVGEPVAPVSVNFSRYSLTEKQFPVRLREIWMRYGIPQDLLEIEVTESVEADDGYNFLNVIKRTREAGFPVSIDDFGVKHANLSLFTAVDFDVLKIDRSLTAELPQNIKAKAVIQSVSDICRKMGIHLIAEGVETEEQLRLLQEMDCGGAQGYLFSRPLPKNEYEEKYLRQ